MKAPMSISVWAMTSGVTRPQRRYSRPNTTPMAALPRNPPKPWYRWEDPRRVAPMASAREPRKAELVQAARQEADDQDLFQQAVLRGRQHQHRDPPPDVGQALGHH